MIIYINILGVDIFKLEIHREKWFTMFLLVIFGARLINIEKEKEWTFNCCKCGRKVICSGDEDLMLCNSCNQDIVYEWMEKLNIKR